MNKDEIRQVASANLKALTLAEHTQLMQKLVQQITSLPEWEAADTVALSLAQDFELQTTLLIQTALLQNKHVGLPRVLPRRQMEFVKISERTEYTRHKFGMLEPKGTQLIQADQFDVVLVPGLAYSETGDRVGFGGGYYDRWLQQVSGIKVATTIGANYWNKALWPIEPTDIKMDRVLILDEEE